MHDAIGSEIPDQDRILALEPSALHVEQKLGGPVIAGSFFSWILNAAVILDPKGTLLVVFLAAAAAPEDDSHWTRRK